MMKKRSLSQLAQLWKTLPRPNWFTPRLPDPQRKRMIVVALFMLVSVLTQFTASATAEQTRIAIAIDPEGRTCVLGGSVDGNPLDADLISKSLKPRQDFRLFDLRGRQSVILWPLGQPQKIENDTCNPHFRQQLSLNASEIGKAQIAIFDGGGNKRIAVLPKTLTLMNTDNEKYKDILATFLKDQKLSDVPLKIHQIGRAHV